MSMEEKKTVKMTVRLTESESKDLKKKAKDASMTEAQLVRLLLKCYNPPAAPGKEFHEDMNKILEVARDLNLLTERMAYRNVGDPEQDIEEIKKLIREEAKSLRDMRAKYLDKYLKGEKVNSKWQ